MAPFIALSSPFIATAAQAALLLATVAGAAATHQQRPEVIAFYGQNAQPTCTPSYWLEFPHETVTTIIMQGWMDPFMIQYAHSHGMRVLMAGEGTGTNLTDPVSRAKAINGSIGAMRSMKLDGVGWDLEAANVDDPHYQHMVALFMAEYRAAWPESFHAFYIGNLQHRNAWEAPAMRMIAASVDLVIVSAYTETNDTAPAGVGRTACDRPCGSTSLPSVQSALHDPVDGWAGVVGKEKLVLALGWFHLQTMKNMTKASDPIIPAQLGVRISFCQAVSLAKSRGLENRRFDNESNSKCVSRQSYMGGI